MSEERKRRRVIVPLVLAVTVVVAAGCKSSSKPHVDAGTGDAPPDIPLI